MVKTINPDILGVTTEITIAELLKETNRMRAENGLQILSFSEELSIAANKKAQDMFGRGYWAHNAPDGTTPWVFIKEANYTYAYAGENLAKDFSNSEDVVQAWMESPRHKDNVLSKNYADIGFAVVSGKLNGRETTLVVQMFGKQAGTYVAKEKGTVEPESFSTQSTAQTALVHGVTRSPVFDLTSLSRNFTTSMAGMLIAILGIDIIIVRRRKIVRLAGHNFDHMLFLSGPLLMSIFEQAGAIL